MNLEHQTQAGDVKLSSFVVPPRCPGSPVDSSDSSTDGPTDYSSLDDYSSQDDDSSDDTEYSSSSDDYSESSEDSSSEDDEEPSRPLYKTLIGKRTIISGLNPHEVATVCSAAAEEEDSESESESMSE